MNHTLFTLLFAQALLGAFDNLWHHELQARLPQRRSARRELTLHALREAIYGLLFIGLAWFDWRGAWALLPSGLLLVEFGVTCADFLEEDRSRQLPPFERVLHTVLAAGYGALLGLFAPVALGWLQLPAAVLPVSHGAWSWLFTLAGLTVIAWSLRNALAVRRLGRIDRIGRISRTGRAEALAGGGAIGTPRKGAPALLVTGGTGFVGSALVRALLREGRRVIVLSRDTRQTRALFGPQIWAVDRLADIPAETRVSAVVHLAGAPVMGLPWTRARRQRLQDSRTHTMQALLQWMRGLEAPPQVLVSASAVGYYGLHHRGPIDERGAPEPARFQSALCIAAEHEAERAAGLGLRVVRLRLGLVLGHGGGVLAPLALSARFGLGARIGHGEQPMPWVHLDDAVALIRHAIDHAALRGAVNAVAPQLVSQAGFMQALAGSYGRGLHLRIPAWLLHGVLGEMAELLTGGQHALPIAALRAGFRFRHPALSDALQALRTPQASQELQELQEPQALQVQRGTDPTPAR